MRELHDALNEGFAAHAKEIERTGVDVTLVARASGAARRRRAWRASGTAAAAVVAIGAVGVAAVAVGGGSPAPATPSGTSSAAGEYAWCDLSTFPVGNAEAYGPARYQGRMYVDYDTQEAVFAAPDGSHQALVPDADGMVSAQYDGQSVREYLSAEFAPSWRHMAFDYWGGGASGGTPYLVAEEGPRLAYEWTTVAPEDAPSPINVTLLTEVHTASMGLGGTGLEPEVAGADAVVESVVTWTDGRERTERIGRGGIGITLEDFTGVESVATRVTLPDGQTYAITSTYDASKTYAAACGDVPILAEDPRAGYVEDPRLAEREFHYGPYLQGPESELFRCLAPLSDAVTDEGMTVEPAQGVQYDEEDFGMDFDFGDLGFKVTGPGEEFENPDVPGPPYPGWGGSWSDDTGTTIGAVTFDAFVWLDDEGRIVARQVVEDPSTADESVADSDGDVAHMVGTSPIWWIGDISGMAVPCDGVSGQEVTDATPVLLYGWGASADDMNWRYARLEG